MKILIINVWKENPLHDNNDSIHNDIKLLMMMMTVLILLMMMIMMIMGVNGAPSTPSGEGVGVGHKMASVTK